MANKFDPSKKKPESGADLIVVPEAWTEPRCHVCQSKYRQAIDRMIALGTSFTEISRVFGGEVDRRSISNHAEKHLRYEERAVRRIIEEQAQDLNENAELGISSELKRRAYLETALHKAMEQLLDDKTFIEPRDAIAVIEQLSKADQRTAGAQLDEIKIQFHSFLQALKEVAAQRGDPSLGSVIRAREIAGTESNLPQLESGQ
jgi:hypothetical protein